MISNFPKVLNSNQSFFRIKVAFALELHEPLWYHVGSHLVLD
jgi:hypothetical protein